MVSDDGVRQIRARVTAAKKAGACSDHLLAADADSVGLCRSKDSGVESDRYPRHVPGLFPGKIGCLPWTSGLARADHSTSIVDLNALTLMTLNSAARTHFAQCAKAKARDLVGTWQIQLDIAAFSLPDAKAVPGHTEEDRRTEAHGVQRLRDDMKEDP
jgi:hypothetical protein